MTFEAIQPDTKPVTIYTPESQLRSPVKLVRAMWHDIIASRELAWRLMVRDLKARYRQSVLGIIWAFLPPIIAALVFIVLNRSDLIHVGQTDIPYPAFVLFGTVLWQLFTESLNAPLKSVSASKSMLSKVNFPGEALILSAIGQVLFDFSFKFVILAAIFILFQIPLSWGILLAFLMIGMLILLGIAIGLFLVPLGILYNDVSSMLTNITALWFFITPVVYPPPERWPFSLLSILNPVSPLLAGARDLATKGTLDNLYAVILVSLFVFMGIFLTWLIYRISLPILIERMG